MATDDSPFTDPDAAREYSRVALVLVGLLAALIATAALPVLAPAGTESPIASVVPIPGGDGGGSGASTGGSGGGGLGALSPGQSTDVGGSLGGESALRSQSSDVHFVVRSPEPTYMRTGGYARYTGDGWEQVGDSHAYDPPIETRGTDGAEVPYEVRLQRSARAVPTVWRPETVSIDAVRVTSERAVRAERAVPAGTTYTGVSQRPPEDPELLRTAGTDYPAAIESRYTQLPAGTERRLGETTDEITANASTPYERAVAVERWLETNKEYSLNVSQPPGDDVASQFVHEMDAGYCEYFATSMVAMLRTQDVPARYVVGYSTGTPAGRDTYEVRGMNAHAWVEVYFPEVGWVQFDPTPADDRRGQERQSLQEQGVQPATETPANETGETGSTETATPTPASTGGNGTDESGGDDGSEAGGAGTYDVSLNRSAAPGATVTVTVTRGGAPLPGEPVRFNGERVGVTNAAGNVTGEVPYDEQLEVTVGTRTPEGSGLVGLDSDRFYDAAPAQIESTTFDVPTNATLAVTGDAVTGNTVTVTAVVDDVPVRDAAVSLNGSPVARTDEDGRADVTLPQDPGQVTLTVERESVTGTRALRLPALAVETRPTTTVALPLATVAINATFDGDPAAGAAVTVDGRQVTTTGVDGTARVTLPLDGDAEIAVERHGQRRTTDFEGLYRNLVGVLLALVVAGTGVVGLARRNDVSPDRLVGAGRAAVQFVVAGVVAVGSAADAGLDRLVARTRLTAAHLRALAVGGRSLAELRDALRAWLDARVEEVRAPVEHGVGAAVTATNGERETDAHATVRDGWERFLAAVSIRRPDRHTPEEIATHAVDVDGLPTEAVETLVTAFRDVEYGQRDPRERAPAVQAAVEVIDDHAAVDGEDGDGDGRAGPSAGVAD